MMNEIFKLICFFDWSHIVLVCNHAHLPKPDKIGSYIHTLFKTTNEVMNCILIHIHNTVTTCSCSSISCTVPYVSDASPGHTLCAEISAVCKFCGFHGHLQIQQKFPCIRYIFHKCLD